MRYFVINTKNYSETSGNQLPKFVSTVWDVSNKDMFKNELEFYVAPPAFGLATAFNSNASYRILAQHVDTQKVGASTGFSVPEIAKSFGAVGSLVNHNEHRISPSEVEQLVSRLRSLQMVSVVCARDDEEVRQFSRFDPDFIAVEPPDLIGSGKAVSKERPEIILESKKALDESKSSESQTRLLCGAGIADGIDAKLSVELGAEGILVASGVVKAESWESKISELAKGLIDARVQI